MLKTSQIVSTLADQHNVQFVLCLSLQQNNPCQSGGTCHGDSECSCLSIYSGDTCEDCRCVRGSCVAADCQCEPGWTGQCTVSIFYVNILDVHVVCYAGKRKVL